VNNSLLMRRLKRLGNLLRDRQGLLEWDRIAFRVDLVQPTPNTFSQRHPIDARARQRFVTLKAIRSSIWLDRLECQTFGDYRPIRCEARFGTRRSRSVDNIGVILWSLSIAQRSTMSRVVVAICACAILAMPGHTISAGHPDLQGNWTNRFATPLERPIELRNKPLLTDAEVAELNKQAARSFNEGHVMVVPSGSSLLALLNDPAHFDAAPTYDPAFFTEMEFENRTSLITDPPTGRLPTYTPEGQRRREAKPQADPGSFADLPMATRCITFGMPRIAGIAGTPSAGIYAYYQNRANERLCRVLHGGDTRRQSYPAERSRSSAVIDSSLER
jgi:hypothetical protein